MRLITFFSVLALAGAALSLDDPVHFGGNVEKFETECVPSTTTATITSTTIATVTVSAIDDAYGGLTSSAADPVLSTLPPLTLTNTSTLTTTTFLTQTAFSASGSSSNCITVTVTSPWSNSSSTHGAGISLTAGVGTGLPTVIPISSGSSLSLVNTLSVAFSAVFLVGLWSFDLRR